MAWGDFVSIYFDVNPDICPPALLPVNVKINLPDVKSECDVFTKNITEAYNQDAYYAYVETLKQKFIKEYIEYASHNTLGRTYKVVKIKPGPFKGPY